MKSRILLPALSVAVIAVTASAFILSRDHEREALLPDLSGPSPTLSPVPATTSPIDAAQPPQVQQASEDPVADFNRNAARMQRDVTEFDKIARVGDAQVQVHFSVAARAQPPRNLDDGKSADFFQPLADAARAGDDAAAAMLHNALTTCSRAPTTADALRAAEGRARDIFAKTGGIINDSPVTLEELLANVRADHARCQGITPQMSVEALDYLRESTERGNVENGLLYAQAISKDMPDEAREIVERIWNEHGRVDALNRLSEVSVPHRIANIALWIAVFDGRDDDGAVRRIAAAREELTAVENTTSPSTFRAATEEAARILGNPVCCVL